MEIITANSLGDGWVVFRSANGGWTRRVQDAEVLTSKESTAAALSAAEADAAMNRIVEPYATPVILEAGRTVPSRLRERIRAAGPTVGSSLRASPIEKVA